MRQALFCRGAHVGRPFTQIRFTSISHIPNGIATCEPLQTPLSGEAWYSCRELFFHLLAQGAVLGKEEGQAAHDFGAFDDGRFDGPGFDGIGDIRRVFRHGDVA